MKRFEAKVKDIIGRDLNKLEQKYEPKTLYCSGSLMNCSKQRRVSVIGSRNASKKELEFAEKVSECLVDNGIIIVSGLALGVDVMAHKTALVNEGKTIAVLGTPINQDYPKNDHRYMQYIIKNNYLAISQYNDNHKTEPKDFAIRNRTMALISNATVVIAAKDKSGSLYQCRETLRLGRPLFIPKYLNDDESLSWVKEMKSEHTFVFEDPKSILDYTF